MSEPRNEGEDPGGLPRATVKRRRWRISVVWAVPLAAAAVAGYLMVGHVREFGPEITIRFEDAGGVKPEQTPILYRGVRVGEVRSVELGKDRKHAVVRARLLRRDASIAREGAMFWIVRPEVGFSSITGLGTVITGPRIEVLPGAGAPKREFMGLENPPVVSDPEGLQIVLLTARLGSLHPGSPVFYRGVEVGAVRDYRLGPDATTVHVRVSVRRRY
ncbi:MAG TPA: MlaD family protein, partial [Candidatus Aquicultoraceae bacterium]|nr:MlaD family protein [Candidatus Aquicultoraceae bacterium]